MLEKRVLVAATAVFMPLIATAHPGDHALFGEVGALFHHLGLPLTVLSIIVAFVAIRRVVRRQSIDRSRD